ncbi:MAG TPA: OB-fold domain-containing protein, partial [Candidatus Melainabacteria bacterium]|nr:OB-fold domain-containing protein [Candidatus Melainabacteria bacterium]
MFAFLKGSIHSKDSSGGPVDRLVLDVSGVGFEVWMASRNLAELGVPGDDVMVHTWLAVRE